MSGSGVIATLILQSAVDGGNGELQSAASLRPQNGPWNRGMGETQTWPGLYGREKKMPWPCWSSSQPSPYSGYAISFYDNWYHVLLLKSWNYLSKLKRTRKCVAVLLSLGRAQNWYQVAKSHTRKSTLHWTCCILVESVWSVVGLPLW